MALGLGELPDQDLLAPIGRESADEAATAGPLDVDLEIVPPDMLPDALEEPALEVPDPAAQAAAISALLGGLVGLEEDLSATQKPAPLVDESEANIAQPREQASAPMPTGVADVGTGDAPPASGVISTDAFLADFDEADVSFSSGFGDEITALTGGGRVRPTATAARVTEPAPDAPALRRDSHVDRDLVMKIIEGVKKL
jgi:hypothetical protein